MSKWTRIAIIGLSSLTLAFGACDGDDDPATDTTADTTADTTDTTADTTDTTVAATDQCTNTSDMALIGDNNNDFTSKAASCGQKTCIGKAGKWDEFEACTKTCMLDVTVPDFEYAVSDGCSGCYAASVRCTGEFCLGSCVTDANSQACLDCRETNGCNDVFATCSGLN